MVVVVGGDGSVCVRLFGLLLVYASVCLPACFGFVVVVVVVGRLRLVCLAALLFVRVVWLGAMRLPLSQRPPLPLLLHPHLILPLRCLLRCRYSVLVLSFFLPLRLCLLGLL